MVALISVFVGLRRTPSESARPCIWGLLHHVVCPFTT